MTTTEGIKIVLHPVADVAAAAQLYSALLGVAPSTESPYYVGFDTAGQHIGLVPNGAHQGMRAPVAHWEVRDLDAKLAEVTAAGGTVQQGPRDVGGGRRVATVTDLDGNVLGLFQDPVTAGS